MISFENILNFNRDEGDQVKHYQDDNLDIDALIADLGAANGRTRRDARALLIRIGEPAVNALIEALNSHNDLTRWEAAKALSQIGSPTAAPAMVKALEDDQFGVRWLAAEGLIKLDRDGLKPLLEALWQNPDSTRLQEGAHHILHDLLSREVFDEHLLVQLKLVFTALNYLDPAVALPATVMSALKVMQ